MSSTRCTAIFSAMAMLAVGLACEIVVFTVCGARSLSELPARLLEVLVGYGSSVGVLAHIAAMAAFLWTVASRWPRWATTFLAGPVLGTAAWNVGVLSLLAWHGEWNMSLWGFLAVVGSFPAMFVGTVMPNVAEAIERRRAKRGSGPRAAAAGPCSMR